MEREVKGEWMLNLGSQEEKWWKDQRWKICFL